MTHCLCERPIVHVGTPDVRVLSINNPQLSVKDSGLQQLREVDASDFRPFTHQTI